MEELRWLSLSWNDLSGPIPPELGGLSNLEWLDLAANDLRARFRRSWAGCRIWNGWT